MWAWLACTAPSIEAWVLARYEDALRLGSAPARQVRRVWMGQIAFGVAMVAIVCDAIGFVMNAGTYR